MLFARLGLNTNFNYSKDILIVSDIRSDRPNNHTLKPDLRRETFAQSDVGNLMVATLRLLCKRGLILLFELLLYKSDVLTHKSY